MPELRQDPATQEWVIVATKRARRGRPSSHAGFLLLLALLAASRPPAPPAADRAFSIARGERPSPRGMRTSHERAR